jgi:hypothetical protein
MPLVVPEIEQPKPANKTPKDPQQSKEDAPKTEAKEDAPKTEAKEDAPKTEAKEDAPKRFDGSKAPGMEGMSEEAIRKFEEAMEIEYQKREGGA